MTKTSRGSEADASAGEEISEETYKKLKEEVVQNGKPKSNPAPDAVIVLGSDPEVQEMTKVRKNLE